MTFRPVNPDLATRLGDQLQRTADAAKAAADAAAKAAAQATAEGTSPAPPKVPQNPVAGG